MTTTGESGAAFGEAKGPSRGSRELCGRDLGSSGSLVVQTVLVTLVGGWWEILVWSFLQFCPRWVESHYLPLCKKRCLLGQGRRQDGLGSEAASDR